MTPAGEERALHWLRLKARIEGELESLTALVGIFGAIAQSMEGGAPVGLRWHRELLEDLRRFCGFLADMAARLRRDP